MEDIENIHDHECEMIHKLSKQLEHSGALNDLFLTFVVTVQKVRTYMCKL